MNFLLRYRLERSGLGVGIAIPGVVETELGFIRKAPNLGWIDVPFGQ